jgi:hypothetical protein
MEQLLLLGRLSVTASSAPGIVTWISSWLLRTVPALKEGRMEQLMHFRKITRNRSCSWVKVV